MKTILLLTLTALLALANVARAQGTAFTYQGRLNDGANPANGIYDMRFTIYDAAVAGAVVGAASDTNGVPVSNGLFTVTLDFGAGLFTGPARWLEVGVKSNAVAGPHATLTPRQALTPSPYAVYAGGAQTATTVATGGVNGAAIAASAVGTSAIADGSINTIDLSPPMLNGTFWRLNGNAGPGSYLGSTDNQPVEVRANNQRVLRLEPGPSSPTLVGGYSGNASSGVQGGFIGGGGAAGALNTLSNHYAAIVGGLLNKAVGLGSFVGGGTEHDVTGDYGAVAGGFRNSASGYASAVVGGVENSGYGSDAFVGAGGGNLAGGNYSAVVGGLRNKMFPGGDYAFTGGGYENWMSGAANYAVTAGGKNNTNTATFATLGGGTTNEVSGNAGVVAGGARNEVAAPFGVVGGGYFNLNWETNGTIAGGSGNRLYGGIAGSTIGGGVNNTIDQTQAGTIAGGIQNRITGNSATASVGGGYQNYIEGNGFAGTISGGYFNVARATYASIGGGHQNTNTGDYATIPGGTRNSAAADYSFAAGRRAKANHTGAFVWADSTDADFSSTAANQFAVRANSGVMIQAATTALDLRGGGAIKVAGAGVGTSTPVFIHRAAATNTAVHITTIDHPHCNGDPNAVLILTHNYSADTAANRYSSEPVGVYYNGSRWAIYHENTGVAMPVGRAFNVLVVKP